MDIRELASIKSGFFEALEKANTEGSLLELKGAYVGKKRGVIADLLARIPSLPSEERKAFGQSVNLLKQEVEEALNRALSGLNAKKSAIPKMDLTLPGKGSHRGHLHPLTTVRREREEIFSSMGYAVASGPEVEDPYHNFEALNTPADHPSRTSRTPSTSKREIFSSGRRPPPCRSARWKLESRL